VPNFLKIRQSVTELLRFFLFFKMADTAIFDFFKMVAAANLNFRNSQILLDQGSGGPGCTIVPNFIKIRKFVAET